MNPCGVVRYKKAAAPRATTNPTSATYFHRTTTCSKSLYQAVIRSITRLNSWKKRPCARSRWWPRKIADSAGVNVSALNAEIETENAMVSANWRKRIPVVPGNNATGTNTATSTSDVAITAPATSFIATDAALCGSVMPSAMCRSTFSITTIASSTTSPVASVMPNSVSVLIEKPKALTNMNVPTNDTGIVIAGMNVLRQSCKNKKMTMITRPTASSNVISTSLIDSPTTVVESNATAYFIPGGKFFESRANSSFAAWSTSRAFAPGSWVTAIPTASWPLNLSS